LCGQGMARLFFCQSLHSVPSLCFTWQNYKKIVNQQIKTQKYSIICMNAEEQKIAENLFFCFNWLLFQILFVFLRHKNNETIKMKKIFVIMFALVGLTANAQGIKNGSKWNVSNLVYEARINVDKTITFTAMAEGEELAFRLTPNQSKKNEYVLSDDKNADGFNPFSKTPRAKYIEQQGWKLLCLYDLKGNLHDVLDGSFFGDGEKVAIGKWMQQIMGKYVDGYGDTLEIGHEIIYEKGVARAEYKNITFNGTVTGVLSISGLTDLEGMWEVVQTLDGLTLYEVEQDEYGMFKRKSQKKTLSWVKTVSRFDYANRILLNDKMFRKMKKSTLRVMRNAILAKHSYMFSSRDLADYFASQPWFSPRPSNDDVLDELSLVEMLNIELIKCEEAKADADRYVIEE